MVAMILKPAFAARKAVLVRQGLAERFGTANGKARACTSASASSAASHASSNASTWRGASGRRYVHSRYSLIECPLLPDATYVLVRRDDTGMATPLHIGIANDAAPSLNLARVRQRGAQLGANEVHVHLAATSDEVRALIACDLRAGQFGTLSAEPTAERGNRHSVTIAHRSIDG